LSFLSNNKNHKFHKQLPEKEESGDRKEKGMDE
jgi:hypothetical protein